MNGFFILFAVAIAADTAVKYLDIPVPGSVVGMLALAVWFTVRDGVDTATQEAAQTLLRYLALLLVPVGVAVVDLAHTLDGALIKMVGVSIAAMILATFTTIATISLAQWVMRKNALLTNT